MSYGRQTAMDGLRKAGEAIRGFDDAYSEKARDLYSPLVNSDSPMLQSLGVAGAYLGGGIPSTRKAEYKKSSTFMNKQHEMAENILVPALSYLHPAQSAAVKYGAPVGGVTLAGQGILDMAAAFGGQADEPEPNQLPLN